GSGAIAIALAKADPRLDLVAVDIDAGALALAAENAAVHSVADRIAFRRGDLLEPLAGSRFRAIVSNPPYVAREEWRALAPDVRLFEPERALVGGDDGLDCVRRLVTGAPALLED